MTNDTTDRPGELHFRKLERMYYAAPINEIFPPTLNVAYGTASLSMAISPTFHHAGGASHGLVYFKMLDDCTYFAANSTVADVFLLTAKFELSFLKPIVDGTVRAVANVDSNDGKYIVASGELFDDDGACVGRGTGTFARSKIKLTPTVHYA